MNVLTRPVVWLSLTLTASATGGADLYKLLFRSVAAAGEPQQTQSWIAIGYRRALSDMASHFWDPGALGIGARIRPTEGNGGPRNGLVVPGGRVPTFWQMAQYSNVLYNAWRIDKESKTAGKIAANWRYVQKIATFRELSGDGATDKSVTISDDAAWKANYLAQVHKVTGDPVALSALLEMIPATLDRFSVPGQPRRTLGMSPAGATIAVGPNGILYAAANDPGSIAQYCFCSSLYETMLANASLYVFRQTGNDAYRDYAAATWDWVNAQLRTVKENDGDTATGVYLTELLLPRNGEGHDAIDRKTPTARNRFWGKPIRNLSAEYDGGTLAMAVLSARLYRLTGEARYLAEARSIIAAFPKLDAFGRRRGTQTLFVNARDPWTEGYWFPAVVSEVLPLPGVDPDRSFRSALIATAKAIVSARTIRGFYGADWSGPELNFTNGTRTWLETAQKANGSAGGGQATPEQIMTSANSVAVIEAAYALMRANGT